MSYVITLCAALLLSWACYLLGRCKERRIVRPMLEEASDALAEDRDQNQKLRVAIIEYLWP